MKINNNRSGCPISTTLDIFGDRWTLIIVRDIFLGRTTFSDFLSSPEKIASNILRDRLKKLIFFEIIKFNIDPSDKKIKRYYLTDKGIDLFPILHHMNGWSTKHLEFELLPLAAEFNKKIKGKPEKQVIKEVASSYREKREKIIIK